MPTVSILMPSYNHARFLPACLESIRSQTFTDWELIAIDDGSKDESIEILRSHAEQDSRIRFAVNETNLGTYGTEQRALEMSNGQFIAIMNSDDLWHPEKLQRQFRLLVSKPDCSLSYVLGSMIDDLGKVIEGEDVHQDWPRTELQEILPFLLYENRVLASGVLFRRQGLRFEPTCRYSGDWVALLERTRDRPVCCIPEGLTYWRQHENNTYKRSVGQMAEEIRVREAILREGIHWLAPRLDPAAVRHGLAKNAMNLFALHVYFKNRPGALRAGMAAAKFHHDKKSALKRTLCCLLPAEFVRNYFWRGSDREWFGEDANEVRQRIVTQPQLNFEF